MTLYVNSCKNPLLIPTTTSAMQGKKSCMRFARESTLHAGIYYAHACAQTGMILNEYREVRHTTAPGRHYIPFAWRRRPAPCDLRVKKLYFDEPGARNLRSDSTSLSRAFGDTLNPFALITPPKPRSSSFSSNSEASLTHSACSTLRV